MARDILAANAADLNDGRAVLAGFGQSIEKTGRPNLLIGMIFRQEWLPGTKIAAKFPLSVGVRCSLWHMRQEALHES
jgi:hypothetical protein